ncbi:hypothetical protein [Mucilaginibacter lappiensis]|uniref:Uncharacterized protein n=1 Tax=Mucilaginibacter lappiensis TaxID=354630 RepID=A0A841J7M1_9SPHI|nr:hypothetical protein [Mucilaginibacter lappiensis]MBB6127179.1 hypothetical protein [Mucilaginibacter lappiensis]
MRIFTRVLIISSCLILTSCSTIIKNAVNKKYPPINTIDKKINSAYSTLNTLDTARYSDAIISVSKNLVDTIGTFELKKTNGRLLINNKIIDSLRIKEFKTLLAPQEITISSRQNIYLSNKHVKTVDFEVTASLSPYYSNDTLYFNPYFNRIHIQKIFFRKCAFLSRVKPIVSILNKVFDVYLENLNGQIKNYFVVIKPLPEGGQKISNVLAKNSDVLIDQDATVKWKSQNFNSSLVVDNRSFNLLLSEKGAISQQKENNIPNNTQLPNISKEELFKKLYDQLQRKNKYMLVKSFDLIDDSLSYLTRVIISNRFLQDNLNYSFNNLNFKFRYPLKFSGSIPNTDVDIKKPNINCDCDDYCNRYIRGNGGLRKMKFELCKTTCPISPFPTFPYVSVPFHTCLTMRTILLAFENDITIGTISGNFLVNNTIYGNFKGIRFSDSLKSVEIDKDLSSKSLIKYNFKYETLNKISAGRLLLLFSSGGCAKFDVNDELSLDGNITPSKFTLKLTKKQLRDSSALKIDILPFTANLLFDHPPADAIATNYSNFITCPLVAALGKLTLDIGKITPGNFVPRKFKDAFTAATEGKYSHTFELNSLTIPLNFKIKSQAFGYINANSKWSNKSILIYTNLLKN